MTTSEDLYADEFEDELEVFEEDNGEGDGYQEGEANTSQAEEAQNQDQNADDKAKKPKRVVRRPQPNLNEERLRGKRGLTALPSYFDRVKYKGKGHEEEDLSVILKTYEYWCHRLFPQWPFDACIEKIENKLGSKRYVQTYVKRIRMDMIQDGENETVVNKEDSDSDQENANDTFNEILNIPNTEPAIEITEEQQEQIRRNKERAEKLRQERLKRAQELSQSSLRESGTSANESLTQYSIESDRHNMLMETEPLELNEDQEECIRKNEKEKEKLKQVKVQSANGESSENQSSIFSESLSQAANHTTNKEIEGSSSDEDIDNIFDKIQDFEERRSDNETSEKADEV